MPTTARFEAAFRVPTVAFVVTAPFFFVALGTPCPLAGNAGVCRAGSTRWGCPSLVCAGASRGTTRTCRRPLGGRASAPSGVTARHSLASKPPRGCEPHASRRAVSTLTGAATCSGSATSPTLCGSDSRGARNRSGSSRCRWPQAPRRPAPPLAPRPPASVDVMSAWIDIPYLIPVTRFAVCGSKAV